MFADSGVGLFPRSMLVILGLTDTVLTQSLKPHPALQEWQRSGYCWELLLYVYVSVENQLRVNFSIFYLFRTQMVGLAMGICVLEE